MWKFVKSGTEINCKLFGVDIFNYKWIRTGEKVVVLDPLYNQEHEMTVYNVDIDNEIFTFATGEFSNGVYGFYINEV